MIKQFFKQFSGNHYRKYQKKCAPIIEAINAHEEAFQSLSDAALREKTNEFKARFEKGEGLDDLLPEAFAVVKNAARRLCGQSLEVCGHSLPWEMVHYDVQLLGGITLHEKRIAEMATGEGKTLVATLPAYLNAVIGNKAILVTVNDYLAKRDAEWMKPIYEFLGLTVGIVISNQELDEKINSYKCDIIYATNNELGFDYLRDNMALSSEHKVQCSLDFAVIDEVDSILIDEARTPLIISGPSSLIISSFPKTIALEMLAPRAKFLDCNNSFSLHEPKVLALQTSFTNEVDEKSIMDSLGSFLCTG